MNTQTETAKLQHNLKKNNTQVCFTFEFNEKHNIQVCFTTEFNGIRNRKKKKSGSVLWVP